MLKKLLYLFLMSLLVLSFSSVLGFLHGNIMETTVYDLMLRNPLNNTIVNMTLCGK